MSLNKTMSIDLYDLVPETLRDRTVGPDFRADSIMKENPPPWIEMELNPEGEDPVRCHYCRCVLHMNGEFMDHISRSWGVCFRCQKWIEACRDERFAPYADLAQKQIEALQKARPKGEPPEKNFGQLRDYKEPEKSGGMKP